MIQNGQQLYFVRLTEAVRTALKAELTAEAYAMKIEQLDFYTQWRAAGGDRTALVNWQISQSLVAEVPDIDTPILMDGYKMYHTNATAGDIAGTLVVCIEPNLRTVLMRPQNLSAQASAWVTAGSVAMLTVQEINEPPRPFRTVDETPEGTFRGNPNASPDDQRAQHGIIQEQQS